MRGGGNQMDRTYGQTLCEFDIEFLSIWLTYSPHF